MRIRHLTTHLLIAFLLILAAGVSGARVQADDPPVTLTMRIAVGTAPATFNVRVITPPHPGNRLVKWCYDDPSSGLKCSQEQLDGATAPYSRTIRWKDVSCGDYLAWAELTRIEGEQERHLLSRKVPFRVLGLGCEPPADEFDQH